MGTRWRRSIAQVSHIATLPDTILSIELDSAPTSPTTPTTPTISAPIPGPMSPADACE
jgi:hypothetical protein